MKTSYAWLSSNMIAFLILICVNSTYGSIFENIQSNTGLTENKGQYIEQPGLWNDKIFFKTSHQGMDLYITSSGISYVFMKKAAGEDELREGEAERKIEWNRVDMKLDAASILETNIIKEDPTPGVLNYFYPHCADGVYGVKEFRKVTIKNVYEGIDWVLYFNQQGFKYDFIVHSGADHSLIKMEYKGATSIRSVNGTELQIKTELGEIKEGKLYAFESTSKRKVRCIYKQVENTVQYLIAGYDQSQDLVIDPPVVWATYYGSTGADGPKDIAIDNADNIYIVGYTTSHVTHTYDPGGGAYYQGTYAGGTWDTYILKFSLNGVREWATHYGGSSDDKPEGVDTDINGNVIMTGLTRSTDFPLYNAGSGAFYDDAFTSSYFEVFIVQFDNNGIRLWSTFFGGSGTNSGYDVSTDAFGNIFVTGTTSSTDNIVLAKAGAYNQSVNNGSRDIFILEFNASRILQWSTYYGGSDVDNVYAMNHDAFNNLVITGSTKSSTFPVFDPGGAAYFDGTLSSTDAIIVKFNSAGARLWATYYGGTGFDEGDDIAFDSANNLYITGQTTSAVLATWNPGGGAYYRNSSLGGDDLFLLKFSDTNIPAWGTFIGGSADDYGFFITGMTTDKFDNVYIIGKTNSMDYPVVDPADGSYVQSAKGGSTFDDDMCLTQFNNIGQMVWSTYYGGPGEDWGRKMVTDSKGCLYATGEWLSTSGITVKNPGSGAYFQGTNGGDDDGFVIKFCDKTILPVTYLTFDVHQVTEKAIALRWSAYSDTEETVFFVQRSDDGNTWMDIGQVLSLEKCKISNHYFSCSNTGRENYFRIMQKDIDGSVSYSKILYVETEERDAFIALSPNPVKTGGEVMVQTSQAYLQYTVVDSKGKTIVNSNLNGITSFSINTIKLTTGIYQLKLTDGIKTVVKKLVVE